MFFEYKDMRAVCAKTYQKLNCIKVPMQVAIAVAHTLRHIETSSLWADFVNKNRCISVRLVSEEVKRI